uniref:Uncharacterized protein n=1 Tax=Rhizophora mucronata TaxID=61149 RepID=A0A2P2P6Z3_RHIMU
MYFRFIFHNYLALGYLCSVILVITLVISFNKSPFD